MITDRPLAVGTRVRLRAPSLLLDLQSNFGHVARPDQWDGYYIVRLERPARYRAPDGSTQVLHEVREAADNMDVVNTGTGLFISDVRGAVAHTSSAIFSVFDTVSTIFSRRDR